MTTCPNCRRRCFTAAEWDALPEGGLVPSDACVRELCGVHDLTCAALAADLRRAEDADLLAAARCFPPGYLSEVAVVLRAGGARYGVDPSATGGGQTREDHLRHAIDHVYGAAMGDTSEPHLLHAAARLALAWEREQAAGADAP